MRFMDHLRLNPMCLDTAKPHGPMFDASFITDATVFEISEIASQMIDHRDDVSMGLGVTVFTEIGKRMVKSAEGRLDLSQYVGIVLPYEDCFFEFPVTWPTRRGPTIEHVNVFDLHHGVHLHEVSPEEKVQGGVSEYAHVVLIHAFAHSVLNGKSISVVHDDGWLASDEDGQLLALNMFPRTPDKSNTTPESWSTLAVLSALMLLNNRLVKSTLSPEVVKSRQQLRYEQRHPDRTIPPFVRYHKLSLNTDDKTISDAVDSGKGGWVMAWHIVRGHLRRYKSGKVITIRSYSKGNPLKGVVLKDYKVKAPTEK